MSFTDLGSLGAIGSTANNQTTLDLTTAAAIAAGEFVVVVVAADNIANGGDDNACSGVTLGVGGQALTKGKQIANALAAQAGASSSLWYGIASSGLASGGTIRATFGSGTLVDASGLTARHFSIGAGNTVDIEGTPGALVSNTAADPGSLDVTTANIETLCIRGIASQVGNNTNLTPTASWTAWANGNSATTGTTGEICARAESRILTSTTAPSNPTYVSAIYASVYVAFKETLGVIDGDLVQNQAANTITAAGSVIVGGTLGLTQAANTISAASDITVSGTLAATQASNTLSAAGTVESPSISGGLTATQANETLAAAGAVLVAATANVTQAAQTLAAAGGTTVRATLDVTQANETLAAAGTLPIGGVLVVTQASETIAAAGAIVVGGTLSATQAAQTLSGTAAVGSVSTGTLNATQAAQVLAATGTIAVSGELAILQAAQTLQASAIAEFVDVLAALDVTQASETLSATASVKVPMPTPAKRSFNIATEKRTAMVPPAARFGSAKRTTASASTKADPRTANVPAAANVAGKVPKDQRIGSVN